MKTLQSSFTARATAFGLAAFLTLVLVGSLDFLATVEPAPGVMAGASQPRA